MLSKKSFLVGLLLLAMLSTGCSSGKPESVSLYAAAGLREAVEALRAEFIKKTGVQVDVDYAGSGVVLARVQKDPLADLFMPADVWYVNRLQERAGLVEESVPVARLIPVLIVAKGNPKNIAGLSDLARPEIKTALGNPKACQIGRLSKLMVDRAGLEWVQVADEESLTVNELAVWVKMNAVDAALVWDSTAATVADGVGILTLDAKPDEISMVACALVKTSSHSEAARAFIRFMVSPEGQQIFEQTGFSKAE